MANYETPPDVDYLSPEEAEEAINKLNAEWVADGGHPLRNKMHPQNKEYTSYRQRLFEIKAEADKPEAPEPHETKAQKRRVAEAESIMNILVEDFDYERGEIPEDITPAHLRGLRQHRLAGEKKFDQLNEQLEIDLRELKAPPDIVALHDSFRKAPDSDTADDLIRWIAKEKKQKGFLL